MKREQPTEQVAAVVVAKRARVRSQIRVAPSLKRPALVMQSVGGAAASKKRASQGNMSDDSSVSVQPSKSSLMSRGNLSVSPASASVRIGGNSPHVRSCSRSALSSAIGRTADS